MPAKLLSVASAIPANALRQEDAAAAAYRSFAARYGDFNRLSRVFHSAGISCRYTVRPLEWYLRPLNWQERNAAYMQGASDLFVDAASRALERADVPAERIDAVVTVSSTGIATPSLEAQTADRLGFRPDIERIPVFGLGCAGGVSGLSIAARMAEARPGSHVLLVAVELCSLAFRLDKLTKANIVATALFGDGAGACVLGSGQTGLATVEAAGQHMWSDTLDIMGWDVDSQGLGVIFDRAIPPFALKNMRPAISKILARHDLDLSAIDRFVCHPGGMKVIAVLEQAFDLGAGKLATERAVLDSYGNMSAPTALFVLERAIAEGLPPRSLLTAMGPGFTASCVSLKAAA